MAKVLQLRRGTTSENDAFTGAIGELTVDTDKHELRLHDGKTVGGYPIPRPSDVVSVKDFGAVGDGVTDDTAAIKAALDAAAVWITDADTTLKSNRSGKIWFDPRCRYVITSPITCRGNISCESSINLVLKPSSTPSVTSNFINFIGRNNISDIHIEIPGDNNFICVLGLSVGKYGSVSIVAENMWPDDLIQQNASSGALRIGYGSTVYNECYINNVYIKNMRIGGFIGRIHRVSIGTAHFETCLSGFNVVKCQNVQIDNYMFYGSLTRTDWKKDIGTAAYRGWDYYASGANGIMIEATKQLNVNKFVSIDSLSHGIRISSEQDNDTGEITFGQTEVYRAGREGVKICGSTVDASGGYTATPAKIYDITFGDVYIEDVARTSDIRLTEKGGVGTFSDYNADGAAGGTNEFGFNAVRVYGMTIGNLVVRKKLNTYASASVGLRVNSCEDVNVSKCNIQNCYYTGIDILEGYNDTNRVNIDGFVKNIGTNSDNTSGSSRGYGLRLHPDSDNGINNLFINLTYQECRRCVKLELSSFASPCHLSGYAWNNFTVIDGNIPATSWFRNDIIVGKSR